MATKHLTMSEVIDKARKAGHEVKAVKRKDGSYRVTEFDGRKFRGNSSEGNNLIRKAMGAPLSRRRRKQLKDASPNLPKKVRDKVKDINRTRKGKDADPSVPEVSEKQVKEILRQKGIREVMRLLKEYERKVRAKIDDSTLRMWADEIRDAAQAALEILGAKGDPTLLSAIARLLKALNGTLTRGARISAYADLRNLRYDFTDLVRRLVKDFAGIPDWKLGGADRASLLDKIRSLAEGLLDAQVA